jgi:hypothetical protein
MPGLAGVPEQQVPSAVRASKVMDCAVPCLPGDRRLRRNHVQRDQRIATVDIVPKQEILDVPVAQLDEFTLSYLTQVPRRHAAAKRPLVVLPRLKLLPAGIRRYSDVSITLRLPERPR